MPAYPCHVTDCPFSTPDVGDAMAAVQMGHHLASEHPPTAAPTHAAGATPRKGPPITRPTVELGISEEKWDSFTKKWTIFKNGSSIEDTTLGAHLFDCCESPLQDDLLKDCPEFNTLNEGAMLDAIKRLAVIPVAVGVRRADLLAMNQDSSESARSFHAKIKGKAATCNYSKKCSCLLEVNFTDTIIKDVFIAGLSDPDIKREVLGWTELDNKSIAETVTFVEGKEMARNAMSGPSHDIAGMSGLKKSRKQDSTPEDKSEAQIAKDLKKTEKCPDCKEAFNTFKKMRSGKINRTPFSKCFNCFKVEAAKKKEEGEGGKSEHGAISIGAFSVSSISNNLQLPRNKKVPLDHHIFTQSEWSSVKRQEHPRVRINVSILEKDYSKFGMASPKSGPCVIGAVTPVTDTGAQACLFPRRDLHRLNLKRSDLFPVKHKITAANRTPISIDGAVLLRLSGDDPDGPHSAAMVYVSPDANEFYLSKQVMIDLLIIPENFPKVGACLTTSVSGVKCESELSPSVATYRAGQQVCDCPKRNLPPGKPEKLPFPCRPENNEKMKNWLLRRYSSSSFNTCPHQTLPGLEIGPPIRIHVDKDAIPYASRTPAPVPLHWQKKVEQDLIRDEQLGVIERVPYGTPTKFCHRMVITRKHDGGPRRTVDMSRLNKQSTREIHSTKAPFQLARSVPANTWKSCLDCWNGYHSLPIHEDDRDLTTFITPIGLFRYVRAPMGFLSSGDGYNRRFDELICGMEGLVRCVDDICPYDNELETHWWHIIELLELLGNAGMVLNPDKFQFADKSVDFAGFRITEKDVEPLPKYLDSIRNFPTPINITDVRSWFGLVNQAAHYNQLRTLIEPFRKFLSPRVPFEWDDNYNRIFEESKISIIEAIKHGVTIFDLELLTCLRADWSEQGIGFYLSQKHCDCPGDMPGCCLDGWQITLAGSRFLHPSESRYCPIEGEALATAWSLEQSRYFTWGCDNLIVITDHQPLVKILGSQSLENITNPRLFRLTQRTLPWIFKIYYMPGKTNWFADALSRHPTSGQAELAAFEMFSCEDDTELEIASAIRENAEKITAVTWERVKSESAKDPDMVDLMRLVEQGFPEEKKPTNPKIAEYWQYRDALFIQDGALMYKDRVIIPLKLRAEILEALHAANQGVSSMLGQAQDTVFWPGITADVEKTRKSCRTCNKNSPSQAKMPPIEQAIPQTPFEQIFADYCDLGRSHYLISGDRLSGWVEIFKIEVGSALSGSKGLLSCLRKLFSSFGVPMELSSDGGPEFTAAATREFLERWGVKHRRSSAYHPQSNGRAEVAVKAAKRALENNVSPDGSLNTDRMVRALLAIRNTPNPACKKSPAEILFNRKLRGTLPLSPFRNSSKFDCKEVDPVWREAWELKEKALKARAIKSEERLSEHSRPLKSLKTGDRVFVQNQTGKNFNKWEKSGTIVESAANDQYHVRLDGTGRVTPRNRRFLRQFEPIDWNPAPQQLPPVPQPAQPHHENLNILQEHHEEDQAVIPDSAPEVHEPAHSPRSEPPEPTKIPSLVTRLANHNKEGRMEKPLNERRRPARY